MSAGSPHIPYGREALESALDNLHGFYRTSVLLWQCQDWKDWESVARIYDTENQWAQVCFQHLNIYIIAVCWNQC